MKNCPSCGEALSDEMIEAAVCDFCGDAFDPMELASGDSEEVTEEKEVAAEAEPKSDKDSESEDEDPDDPRPNKKGRR